ncbi:MAG TPA: hypothetical protein CFH83_06595 [Sulfuricurvum kujiense]|uniref:Cyclic nucleotide-binding domain-containing protein n=1 Tax=Sulfuricurvum kujiense TaxID=148813 RepID=A0A2D3WGW7_9BACT|nr:ParB/Srx family N-terminal domain-containing protein [Sulfuricurvum kujiense]DAB38320.1 MAG TPA: hypothetical protein CFH83_06595 [Sulfuricurvum kujiense]
MSHYSWLEKKVLRSVDLLRLWPDNPRLDPDEKHLNIIEYTSDLLSDNGEKDSFLKLVDSISSQGYIPADPVVIWQNEENDKYYVAEGNRRILALKLLRNPQKAPKSIRSFIRKKAELLDRDSIEKIKVCVAPSFEECEWYINQRHALSSLQRPWSRLQQQRWIAELYDKYEGNIEKVMSITGLNKGQLEYTLRILTIRDLALDPVVMKELDSLEQEKVKSHRIPMTILERWFMNPQVREKWGFEFEDDKFRIISNRKSFLFAYAIWLKHVIHRDDLDVQIQINTRTITSNLDILIEQLPQVSFEQENEEVTSESMDTEHPNINESRTESNTVEPPSKRPINKNPDRNQMIYENYQLNTSNYKLDALFRELKVLPIVKYRNCAAISLRVFLDLSINEYINVENCKEEVCSRYNNKPFQDITLKQRLEYIKQNKLASKTPAYKVVEKLLNTNNDYCLDTLNVYIHGVETHHTGKHFLNGFWDFLSPLLKEIIDLKEV